MPCGLLALLCASAVLLAGAPAPGADALDGPGPWPAVRKERIRSLLGPAMARAGVDAWLVLCRENDNDPLAAHVGGENAGGTAMLAFFRRGETVESFALSPAGEATALRDVGLHDHVESFERPSEIPVRLLALLRERDPGRIAVNASEGLAAADGLSSTQRRLLEAALLPELAGRLVSSEPLVVEWLSVKLPAEVEILRRAAALTAQLEMDAYAQVVPGVTRDHDLARYLKKRMAELGVGDAWAPDQNPSVNSGLDRGHSHATDKVIQPGDVIQTDFGIRVHGTWVTDVQRFAYVLRPGEAAPPPDVQRYWEAARRGSRIALAAMKPGVTGYEVDRAQRQWMKEAGSEPVRWGTGHPVGYWAHDVGPALSGAQREAPPPPASRRVLRPGQTFAFDGFFSWKVPGGTKTISVEEMAVVTAGGAEYLVPPQEELVLIPPPASTR
ncbi:MAG TPA: M24 family metallopeptidase [Vicinamibacteria bacterium]|nr:M24 family metallopeptidase [Vicinamibacteria bacterium]